MIEPLMQTTVCIIPDHSSNSVRHTEEQLSLQRRHRSPESRRRRWTLTATIEQHGDPGEDVLMPILEAARTELLAQSAGEASLDDRTIGILAFNGALLADDLAARDLLGRWWWTPLMALGLSTLICLWSILRVEADYRSVALRSYAQHGKRASFTAKEQLLGDLSGACEEGTKRARHKATCLRLALGILLVGLIATAALTIASEGP